MDKIKDCETEIQPVLFKDVELDGKVIGRVKAPNQLDMVRITNYSKLTDIWDIVPRAFDCLIESWVYDSPISYDSAKTLDINIQNSFINALFEMITMQFSALEAVSKN
mgnify:CR=1 FL=1